LAIVDLPAPQSGVESLNFYS